MIPVRIEPAFWLLAALIGWLNSSSLPLTILWIMMIFISVLAHEYGHAITALFFGQKSRITLTLFGGVTTRAGKKLSSVKEFLIVLNGPMAGFAHYGLCVALLQSPLKQNETIAYFLTVGTWTNLFWTILNLVPVQPLDGGHLLMILCRSLFGPAGVKAAYLLSLVASIVLGVLFFMTGAILAGSIFLLFAFESFRSFRTARFMTESDQDEGLRKEFEEALRLLRKGREGPAEHSLRQVIASAPSGMLHMAATARLAELVAARDEYGEAYTLLAPIKSELEIGDLKLFQKCAFKLDHYEEALNVGEGLYREEVSQETALVNAMCASMLKQPEAALGWLLTAQRDGADLSTCLADKHFDPIRGLEGFKAF